MMYHDARNAAIAEAVEHIRQKYLCNSCRKMNPLSLTLSLMDNHPYCYYGYIISNDLANLHFEIPQG